MGKHKASGFAWKRLGDLAMRIIIQLVCIRAFLLCKQKHQYTYIYIYKDIGIDIDIDLEIEIDIDK